MEDIEQLNSMFNAHYPGLWTAVEKYQVKNIEKLLNGNINKRFFLLLSGSTKFANFLKNLKFLMNFLKVYSRADTCFLPKSALDRIVE